MIFNTFLKLNHFYLCLNWIFEVIIMDDTRRSKKRPSLPTFKNTIQIRNKTNRKPSIPTINETVPLEEPPSML